MKHILYLSCYLSILSMLFVGCKEKKAVQSGPVDIPVYEVVPKDISLKKDFVGQVYGEKDIPIRARVEGFLEGIHFDEGHFVEKGQLLYSIDPQPFEAKVNTQKSRLAEAKTNMVKAESDLNRYKPLAEENAVSQSDLDAAQAEYDAAVSSVSAAKSNLRSSEIELGYTKIYSPLSGLIGITQAKVGDFVGREPNPVILNTVSKTDEVKVKFFLTEAEYIILSREFTQKQKKIDTNEELEEARGGDLELLLSDGSIYEYKGTTEFIDRGVNASTGSILVQASFPNPKLFLRPGMYAKIIAPMKEMKDAILIPQRCVQELQGQYSVFVVGDDSIVVAKQIEIRTSYNDYWVVLKGISGGDKIVLEGIQKVGPGAKVNPIVTAFESKSNQQ